MDAYTCYGNQHDVEGRNFGKLAVIAPMLERIKLKEIINQHIPADVQARSDHILSAAASLPPEYAARRASQGTPHHERIAAEIL